MTTGWSHPDGLSPAQVQHKANRAEEARKKQERIDAMRPTGKGDTSGYDVYGGPEVTGRSTNEGSRSGSVSRSFDYTGMDEASKVAQALQAAEGSVVDVALNDPMKIPALQNSIRSMQQYLAAYNSGNGLPPVRVSSESISSSSSPGSTSQSFGRKKLASHVLTKEDDEQGGQQPPAPAVPPAQEPLVDVRGQVTGGPDNTQLVSDAAFGIPSNVDTIVDPTQQKTGEVARRPGSSFSSRGKPQGPPMPGLQHSASLWDLDYYV